MRSCLYCGQETPDADFSLEHIFPKSLGGALLPPQLFQTRFVCERCNNIYGLFVDGAFIKGALHSMDNAVNSLRYCDPRRITSIAPLAYMGRLREPIFGSELVCDVWLGAVGERAFHLYKRDEERWDSFIGGNPTLRRRRRDPGEVFIRFTSSQNDWLNLMLRSVKYHFPDAKRFGIGAEFTPGSEDNGYILPMDAEASRKAELLSSLGDELATVIIIDSAFDERFMCKLALGLGFNLFGEAFLAEDYTHRLRSAMREMDREARAAYEVLGSTYLTTQDEERAKVVGWEGAYTILLSIINEKFALSLFLPGRTSTHVVIAINPDLWDHAKFLKYRSGTIHIVVPQLNTSVDSIDFGAFLMHKFGFSPISELTRLTDCIVDQSALPEPR